MNVLREARADRLAGTADPSKSFSASDCAGAVEVSVDGTATVVAVRVADDWPQRTTPAALATHVRAAFDQARGQALESMRDRPDSRSRYDHPVEHEARRDEPVAGGTYASDPLDALRALRSLRSWAEEQVSRVEAAQARAQQQVVGMTTAAWVRAVVASDGALADLSIGDPFGRNTRVTDLGTSIRDAIRQAQQEAMLRRQHLSHVLEAAWSPPTSQGADT